jgi:hypothetical protein
MNINQCLLVYNTFATVIVTTKWIFTGAIYIFYSNKNLLKAAQTNKNGGISGATIRTDYWNSWRQYITVVTHGS